MTIEYRYTDDKPGNVPVRAHEEEDGKLVFTIWRGLPAAERNEAVRAILRERRARRHGLLLVRAAAALARHATQLHLPAAVPAAAAVAGMTAGLTLAHPAHGRRPPSARPGTAAARTLPAAPMRAAALLPRHPDRAHRVAGHQATGREQGDRPGTALHLPTQGSRPVPAPSATPAAAAPAPVYGGSAAPAPSVSAPRPTLPPVPPPLPEPSPTQTCVTVAGVKVCLPG